MAGIDVDKTLSSLNATETQIRTKTDVSGYSEDGGKLERTLRKTGAELGSTQRSCDVEQESNPQPPSALAGVTAH